VPACHHERSEGSRRCVLPAVVALLALGASTASAQKLYITNQIGATITVVDQGKLAIDTTIDLKKLGFSANAKPHHTVVEPDGSFWYATLIGDGKVLKFDRANKLVGQVSMETPGLLAIDPKHDSLFVGRSMTAVNPPKSLGVVKRSTFELVDEQEIQIPRPHALVVTRDGKWVHAASLGENRIASLETATGRVTLSTLPGDNFRSMVQFTISPNGNRLIVGGEVSNSVMTFSLGGRPPLVPASEVAVGGKPWDPVFSPDGTRAYFSLFADSGVVEMDLTGDKPRVTRTFRGGMSQPYDMIMRADGKYLFVVNQNLAPVKPGASAHDNMPGMGASATPGAATGYLSVIDVATGTVVKTLMLGAGPTGMGAAGAR
jgi:DNA-binding beta-propeller fold protein YncE